MNTLLSRLLLCLSLLLLLWRPAVAVDADSLLPPEKAFVPEVTVTDSGVAVRFQVAEGYYLYQQKISATTLPDGLLGAAEYSPGKEKTDEFFGTQEVYYHSAEILWSYRNGASGEPYVLQLSYQGCAEVGVCYPPVQNEFSIQGNGQYRPDSGGHPFLQNTPAPATPAPKPGSQRFILSWDTLNANLLAFFVAGIGLSLTACMYPLLPIVSGIIVGDRRGGKRRALLLSGVYVQGLAFTYTAVGVAAGLTGSLLTVWLQQPWVVLAAASLMVVLALAMFDLYSLQLPSRIQSFFQSQSTRLPGGRYASVLLMGMFSALIVGPCVAPPLAFALGYIGKTGDAVLGGLALYVLALGTGLPLMLVATFGGHILPRAGAWMNGIKYAFGLLLLAAAVYLATPFLPYGVAVVSYALLMVVPGGLLLTRARRFSGSLKNTAWLLGMVLLGGGVYFSTQSVRMQATGLHRALTLTPPQTQHYGQSFFHPDDLNGAVAQAFAKQPAQPVLVDFYADWCVSCKEMAAYTFSDPAVQAVLDEQRFLQIDVTANTPQQQALLRHYGLYGPPGLFVLHADGRRSEALLGFAKPDDFLHWYRQQTEQDTP